jgi:regulator of ribonuclease activity A
MRFSTADLADDHPDALILEPGMRHFGARDHYAGPIRTVRCHDDNSFVRASVEESGDGAVLVVDGGGSMRCALLGDRLAALAASNGWAGVIINGCVRDSDELARIDLGIVALAAHPRRSEKRSTGDRQVAVSFGGVTFEPGHWVAVDPDGVLVLESPPEG